ncbi:MAG: nickel/cobalt transporter [Hyphomicrobium sp.]
MRTWLSVMLLAVLLAIPNAAMAQSTEAPSSSAQPGDGTPKALPGLGSARTASGPDAPERAVPATGLWGWIVQTQQRINRALTAAVRDLKQSGSVASAGMLAFLSFAYGVLHAAGPGHGKAVISSYVLANEKTVRRGILLSFLAALIQALSAITIVGILYGLMKSTSLEMRAAEAWIETLSWGLVAGVGAWLLVRQFKKLNSGRSLPAKVTSGCAQHGHDHTHSHACGHDHHDQAHEHSHSVATASVEDGHQHEPGADGTCAHCGHAHMPDPRLLEGDLGWRKAFAIAFSVGIRPCTGAILVLVFALSQGMLWAGVFATFAMAIGTAITVSVLAALAVGFRELAQRMAGNESGWGQRIETAVGFAGSAAVFLMGAAFFIASLKGPPPL